MSDATRLMLLILVPLLVAPMCYVLRSPRIAWLMTLATALFGFLTSIELLFSVLETGGFSYHLGDRNT